MRLWLHRMHTVMISSYVKSLMLLHHDIWYGFNLVIILLHLKRSTHTWRWEAHSLPASQTTCYLPPHAALVLNYLPGTLACLDL
jgi:hypothetical protein